MVSNGVKLLCPDTSVGDTKTMDGIVYTKRTWNCISRATAATTCINGITDMSFMFADASKFNEPIGGWDTSEVFTMDFMFCDGINFNQDLSGWFVSHIGSELLHFAAKSELSSSNYPVWGSCPS